MLKLSWCESCRDLRTSQPTPPTNISNHNELHTPPRTTSVRLPRVYGIYSDENEYPPVPCDPVPQTTQGTRAGGHKQALQEDRCQAYSRAMPAVRSEMGTSCGDGNIMRRGITPSVAASALHAAQATNILQRSATQPPGVAIIRVRERACIYLRLFKEIHNSQEIL